MNNKLINRIKFSLAIMVVLGLVSLVGWSSYALLSNSISEQVKIDKTTSNYLSFNYAKMNEYTVEIVEPKVMSDFFGKYLLKPFDFEVEVPKEYIKSESVKYEVIVSDLGNLIDEEYIKFYLTDQNDNKVNEREVVPVYSSLSDTTEGKIIYSGEFNKDSLSKKLRLRIWVSDKYDKDIKGILAYRLQVRVV